MLDENLDPGTPALETEPAPAETPVTDPVTDPPADPVSTEDAPAEPGKESTEAPKVEGEPEGEPKTDDDPFAEFESVAVKDKDHYEELFKTEKWKHVPHAARDEIRALVDEKAAIESVIKEIGGQPMISTFKPVSDAILDPDVSPEKVEAAFDAINAHNPKVIETLGAQFTEHWVKEVVADPANNLSPLMQHIFTQFFGKEAAIYDLNSVLEMVQLSMARDSDGDPILDIESARSLFEANGGHSAFKYQQEKAAYERRIAELQNGYKPAAPAQISAPEYDVDKDLETENLPKAEALLTKIGYKKTDPEYSMAVDAMKYRLRHAPETDRIRAFAKNGSYKTADGYVQGVQNNREYLGNRVYAQLIQEMKGVQARRKGTTTSPGSAANLDTTPPKTEQEQPKVTPPVQRDLNKKATFEDIAEQAAANFKKRISDENAAAAIAAGR